VSTVRTLIEDALKKIHVLGSGQSMTGEQAQDALRSLNDLIESWSVEGGLVYTQTRETFNLTSAASYTIGVGGDFNTTRPVEIVSAYVTQGSTDYILSKYDQKQYSEISQKNIGGIPNLYYFDNNYPLSNIFLYPTPVGATTITLYSVKPITSFASVNDVISLPAGYRRALVYNLAVELAPNYERDAARDVKQIADESKGNVFSYNSRNDNSVSTVDDALVINAYIYDIERGY
jgi:hypothetical protein